MSKNQPVPRPNKKSEFYIVYGTRQAEKGWRDLLATQRNALVETWDALTRSPRTVSPTNYPLKGELAFITRDGVQYERRQHKPTLGGTARIWFYIVDDKVCLEQVHTAHPNETK